MYENKRSFQRIFEPAMLRWGSGNYDQPGVESWLSFSRRVERAATIIMAENGRRKTVLVFTSGGPICATLHRAIGVTAQTAIRLNWQIRNGSVSTFKYNDEGIFLASFNSLAHLEQQNDPSLLTYR
jgi:broad specificity phosphatase PhoE